MRILPRAVEGILGGSATGRDAHGGYAELMMVVPKAFAYRIPEQFTDAGPRTLLCAGAIGYRSMRLTGLKDGQNLGLAGSEPPLTSSSRWSATATPNRGCSSSLVRNPSGPLLGTGCGVAGDTLEKSPEKLHAIIDTTPVWTPVLRASKTWRMAGGSDQRDPKGNTDKHVLAQIDYPSHLWHEKELKSVANVTRADVREFLELAALVPIKPAVQEYPLEDANQALAELKASSNREHKVLRVVISCPWSLVDLWVIRVPPRARSAIEACGDAGLFLLWPS